MGDENPDGDHTAQNLWLSNAELCMIMGGPYSSLLAHLYQSGCPESGANQKSTL